MSPSGDASSAPPILSVSTPLGDVFAVTAFDGREGVSRLFEFSVDLVASATQTVGFDQLLGRGVTVHLLQSDGAPRHFHGLVRSVAQGGSSTDQSGHRRTAYRLTLVPALWTLTRHRQSRIFQQLSVSAILEKVLTGLPVKLDLRGHYEPRNYCVQYRETDFAFASRLMEEEGIFYFFTHADGQHTMVVADQPAAHPTHPGAPIPIHAPEGGVRPDDAIYTWQKEQTLTAGKVVLWDHAFEMPGRNHAAQAPVQASLQVGTVSHKLSVGGNDKMELYDYPGGYAKRFDGIDSGGGERASDVQKIAQDNERTAKLRMQEEEALAVKTEGASTCRQLVSGYKLSLTGHENADGSYVILELEHEARAGDVALSSASAGFTYKNRFTCVPAAVAYRPPQTTPRPHVAGCQTATVVGPRGEEIFVDKYGRVKVQFHWDREGKLDANSSCWVRVASPWAGKKWGAVHLPRIGQEVVVDFLEGDPDRPIIVGSVYNAEQMPPYVLPANRTQSGVKSRSSPQGTDETFNELRFEDKKGEEEVHLQAQKDLTILVKNDETRTVDHDRRTTIGRHDYTELKPKEDGGVGNQDLTMHKGDRSILLKEGSQSTVLEKGQLLVDIKQGDHDLRVNGNERTKVTLGDREVTVADGHHTIEVQKGNQKVQVKMGNDETIVDMGNYTLQCKMGNIAIKANLGTITLESMSGVELKCGQSSVKVDQMGVTVKGMMAKVEGMTMAQLKSPMTQVNGDAMLTAKGGITMIN
jgi:type VI secretion system secreted protein VgrG